MSEAGATAGVAVLARPPSTKSDRPTSRAGRRRWYVRRAIALNTVVIDHLRSEYSAWVDWLRRGSSLV